MSSMQKEILRCYVKPATVFPSPDKCCAGSTADSSVKMHCSADLDRKRG